MRPVNELTDDDHEGNQNHRRDVPEGDDGHEGDDGDDDFQVRGILIVFVI